MKYTFSASGKLILHGMHVVADVSIAEEAQELVRKANACDGLILALSECVAVLKRLAPAGHGEGTFVRARDAIVAASSFASDDERDRFDLQR